jgi:hypothetical protein
VAQKTADVRVIVHDQDPAALHTGSIPDRSENFLRGRQDEDVGRVLICEPDPEVRELLRRVVVRRGHEAVLEANGLRDLAAVVLEPSDVTSVELAQAARALDAAVPIVCASIEPPTAGSRKLGPVAHIVKPFTLSEIDRALSAALDRRNGTGR